MSLVVEALEHRHWNDVCRVYQEGLDTGNASFETTAPDWPTWDAAHHRDARLVALDVSGVCGWAALTPVSPRPVYVGVASVSVYVAALARGHGVGRRLLNELIRRSERAGIWTLQASIFPENVASLGLHQLCGFRVVGRRERIGQHRGVWRDTVWLERRSAVVGVESVTC